MVDDSDPVAETVRLFHVVRREDEGRPHLPTEAFDVVPDVLPGLGVEAEGRLVEEDDWRMVQKPPRNLEPSLHPPGESLDEGVLALLQVDECEKLLDPVRADRLRHPVQPCMQLEVLSGGERGVNRRLLEDNPARCADFGRLSGNVEPIDERPPLSDRPDSDEHRNRRRLPRAVRPEQPEDLPLADIEVDVVDGDEVAEALRETAGLDHYAVARGRGVHEDHASPPRGRLDPFMMIRLPTREVGRGHERESVLTSEIGICPCYMYKG